jgi:hypothetical protein
MPRRKVKTVPENISQVYGDIFLVYTKVCRKKFVRPFKFEDDETGYLLIFTALVVVILS